MNTLGIIIIIAALLFCLWVAILVIRNLYYMNALPVWLHSLIYKVGNFRSWRTTTTQTQPPYTRPRTRVFAQETTTKFFIWLSIRLPDHLIYWCTMHLFAYATSGKYKGQEIPALTVIDAIDRWDKDKLK